MAAYNNSSEQLFPFGYPTGMSQRGSVIADLGEDFNGFYFDGGGWFSMMYSNEVENPAVQTVVSYDNFTGMLWPFGSPAGYQQRGSMLVFHGSDAMENPLTPFAGGWLSFYFRDDVLDAAPMLPVVGYDNASGRSWPYGLPAGYVPRGSLFVAQATDHEEHFMSGGGWLMLCYREELLSRNPALRESTALEQADDKFAARAAVRSVYNFVRPRSERTLRHVAFPVFGADVPAQISIYEVEADLSAFREVFRSQATQASYGGRDVWSRPVNLKLNPGKIYGIGVGLPQGLELDEGALLPDPEYVDLLWRYEIEAEAWDAETVPMRLFFDADLE